MRTKWTKDQIDDFRQWHEKRLVECEYPEAVSRQLRNDREKWLPEEEKPNDRV